MMFHFFLFAVLTLIRSSFQCNSEGCHTLNKQLQEINITTENVPGWMTFCYKGHKTSILFLWLNPMLNVKFNISDLPTDYQWVRGETEEEVESQKSNMNPLKHMLQRFNIMMNKDSETVAFTAFNTSCVGIYSDKPYSAMLLIKLVEMWLVASFFTGLFLFLSAKSWSRNTSLHYGAGVSTGVIASLIILIFIMYRIFPQSIKKLWYILLAVGCSASLYMWTTVSKYLLNPTADTLAEYWKWITGYVIFSGLISFGICYKYGPVTDDRTLSLIQWTLQMLGLCLIYHGTQIREVSVAVIFILLFLYNLRLPETVANSLSGLICHYRYKFFPPKIRFLTEEEFEQEGIEETKKALEELRSFCKSPECNVWKTIGKLKDPSRFAGFIEGNSWHVTDEELENYDSMPEDMPARDSEEDEEEEEEEEISGELSVHIGEETDMDTTEDSIASGE